MAFEVVTKILRKRPSEDRNDRAFANGSQSLLRLVSTSYAGRQGRAAQTCERTRAARSFAKNPNPDGLGASR
jgi:hypothetical protein